MHALLQEYPLKFLVQEMDTRCRRSFHVPAPLDALLHREAAAPYAAKSMASSVYGNNPILQGHPYPHDTCIHEGQETQQDMRW
jgi:hypothetical protein